jgi:DNA-binding GntR family transcriptional regulator
MQSLLSDLAPAAERAATADAVYDRLLTAIVRGGFAPGERLDVDALAAEYAVTRTPVRDAVARLRWMRFVVVERNGRNVVADWCALEMRDRLRVVTRIAALMAADPELPLDRVSLALDSADGDVDRFVALAEMLVRTATNRVAAHTVRDHLEPLRLFLEPDVVGRHGIELADGADRRVEALAAVRSAAAAGDRAGVVRAFVVCGDLIARSLDEPEPLTAA